MASEVLEVSYEDLRRRNIERNEDMMRSLGLFIQRDEIQCDVKPTQSSRRRRHVTVCTIKLRRSARIAANTKTTTTSQELSTTEASAFLKVFPNVKVRERKEVIDKECKQEEAANVKKGRASAMEKEEFQNVVDDNSDNNSFDSEYEVDFNINGDEDDFFSKPEQDHASSHDLAKTTGTAISLESLKTMTPQDFGTQFQEVIIRALLQSSGALLGPSPSTQSPIKSGPSGGEVLSKGSNSLASMWDEGTYNRMAAERKRKPPMTRTSAGEDSDSQEEFPIPQNESLKERSLRIRRLNRSRSKKAKDLINNRKAMKKLPNVIHIDGTGRAKGIHKHLWRAAIRGQCTRLDPTMDNINHHPKHVVDSIWQALEKDWEFEGFAHRAREMFERSATKYMRNRKMQLKRKCLRDIDGPKPSEVSPVHWGKIVHLTKQSLKQGMCTTSIQRRVEENENVSDVLQERNEQALLLQGSDQATQGRSPNMHPQSTAFSIMDEENVDMRIQRLQNELLRLQNSRESRQGSTKDFDKGKATWNEEMAPIYDVVGDFDGMKENMRPHKVKGDLLLAGDVRTTGRDIKEKLDQKSSNAAGKSKWPSVPRGAPPIVEPLPGEEITTVEVECGDLVSILSVSEGRKEELGKAIVMGMAGSKYARKVIPKGWYLIKVYMCTNAGASEVCPFPAGWAEQVKHKTLKDAEGRNILWPNSLLRI